MGVTLALQAFEPGQAHACVPRLSAPARRGLSVLRCALAVGGLSPVVAAPQAMTAISQATPWLRGSAKTRIPRRSKARR